MTDVSLTNSDGDRLAKIIARAGLCSRRDAELWIKDGRVSVNGKVVKTPAFNVTDKDKIKVDGEPLAAKQGTRVWLYHKPEGLVVTEKDPEGRPTIFEALEEHGLPRVVTIGRLDINTEGLLLLTNDGGLKRTLELPATGWLRKYRVRAFGTVTQAQLDQLKDGIEVEGIKYGPIEAILERDLGSNVWLVVALREGKNREVKNVLAALGLQVNRLIRISYGPFQLGDLPIGAVETVKARVLREQLGKRLTEESGADFDSDMPEQATATDRRRAANPKLRAAAPGKAAPKQRKEIEQSTAEFRFTDRDPAPRDDEALQRRDRPGGRYTQRKPMPGKPPREEQYVPLRTVHHEDGTTSQVKIKPERPRREDGDDKPFRRGATRAPGGFGDKPARSFGDKPARSFGDKPARSFGDKPKRDYGDKPARSFGDQPRGNFADRPKRDYGDKPAGDRPERSYASKPRGDFADRPKRDFGDRPPRAAAGERPARSYGDKPARSFGDKPRGNFADRPKRDYGDKPAGDRPARSFGDKPKRDYGDKPRAPRAAGDKPYAPRAPRAAGDKPYAPRTPRAGGDKPFAGKPRAGGEKVFGAKPYAGKSGAGGKPAGGKPYAGKPRAPRPDGDRPRPSGPRKPRA
jgi:23S rRNA pseudouridine2605 synthase